MQKYKVDVFFKKTGLLRFISHLDLMRLFRRALLRTNIDLIISEGFNPHPRLSIKKALKVGSEGVDEEMSFFIKKRYEKNKIKYNLKQQMPIGIEIIKVNIDI